MNQPAIKFSNVWKSYPSYRHVTGGIKSFLFNLPQALRELRQRRTALEDISFEIPKGNKFGIIGRNGAGKSTTLGLIAGVLSPDLGTVQINGRISPLLQLGAGFHPELSGRDNIMLNGVLLGMTRKEVLEYQDRIIEFSGIQDFLDQPVRTYSSGMYAKLGFSVVSILKPEILLLDEILAVGDEAFQHKCEAKFEEFRSDPNITMILVSHSLGSVAKFCDTAIWIENKKIKTIGPAVDIVKDYRSSFSPKINVIKNNSVEDVPPSIRDIKNFNKGKEVYLFRHCHSVANEQHLVNGTPDDPLTEKGIAQAKVTANLLDLYDLQFNCYYVSHWKRARETATLVLPGKVFKVDPRLGETDAGLAAQMTFSEFSAAYPKFRFPIDMEQAFPSGECHREVYERAVAWFEETVASTPENAKILAISHVGPISCILQYVTQMGMNNFPAFIPHHGSLTKLVQVAPLNWKVEYFSLCHPDLYRNSQLA